MPMPRLTICPASTSAAALRTMSSRDQLMPSLAPDQSARHQVLDDVAMAAHLDDALDEDPRQVDVVGVDRAAVNQLVDLGDGDVRRHRHQWVEVARRAV